ncbi:hypothetical protein [Streptomyces afghaniensis]|uniref:hypothetical protein n=1 Tax=Streptomyces afghaniensis TaxID=66865 RepID=UPI0027840244|nr:hypothetical protein [Streptomyces afghaniensis]MDQ1021454.1 hypothetical protein [Streptomyces afghaniensis]
MSSGGPASATGVVLARPDVSALRTRQGAWVGVGSSSFTVRGSSAFQVVSTLLSRSDGSRTGHELVDEFPAGSRPAVSRVLDALVARRCVAVLDAPMSQQVAAKGPASKWLIPYLSQLTDEPVRALDRVLATTLHLCGRPDWLDRLRQLLESAPLFGLRTEFHAVSAEDLVPLWENAGLVVVDADGLSYERTVRLQDALLERGVPHGVVGEVCGRRWILWSDDTATGCWECLCRYGRTAQSAARADTAATASEDATAAALIHAIYQRSAGLGEHAAAAVSMPLASDLPTVTTHPAWSAAGCRCHRAVVPSVTGGERDGAAEVLVRRNIVGPEDDSRLDDVHERIIDTLTGWTDEYAGPFRYLDGGGLSQVPFGQARATVLVGLAEDCRVHELTTATLSPREAIYQAALNALERFAHPAVGAGWSLDEAVYRALLKRSMAQPVDPSAWVRLSDDDLGHGECAGFSRYIQRAVARVGGGEAPQWTGTRLPNGMHRVTGRTAGEVVARGAGVCYAEAVSTALLGLVNDDGALVPVNPHFPTWTQVWRHIARPECAEVTARTVPFARGRARLVEVT